MPDEKPDVARELTTLEAELKRLEAEYNMFFAGRLPRPPWETRGRVQALVKRLAAFGIRASKEEAAASGGEEAPPPSSGRSPFPGKPGEEE